MIKFKHIAVLFFALLNILSVSSRADVYRIDGVLIEGNRNIDTDAIKLQLKHPTGELSDQAISEEVKNLYRTEFFDQVEASVISNAGKTYVKYSLIEKPIVRKVFIKGNDKISEEDLAKIFNFGQKRFLDKTKIEALIRSAVSYYQKDGFYDASFEYAVSPIADGQVDLTFTVQEGQRVKIRKINFQGLSDVDDGDLRSAMETKRYKWWNSWLLGSGRLNKDVLDNDKLLLRQYFLDQGFVEGNVGDPNIERNEDGIYITFSVNEGKRYKFGDIVVSGDLIEQDQQKTLEGTKAAKGEYFSAGTLRDDSFKISDKFADQGFAFVNVVPNTSLNREAGLVDISYAVSKGRQVKVGKINIKGNTRTYDNVIRRELKLSEQDTYSSTKMRRSQELLQRLGYFEEATVNMEPAQKEDEVNLNVNVREASTGQFSAGAGYSTSDGMLFNARVSENNLFGTGRNASINFDIGSKRENIILSVTDRRFDDTHLSLGADLYRTVREFSDFDRELTGGSLTAGYPLEELFGESAEDINASLKYEALAVDISNVDQDNAAQLVIDSEGNSTASGITPSITRNTLNHPFDPTKGSLQEVAVELTGLGGDERYYLGEARQSLYEPLFDLGFGDFVFSWRTKFGYGKSFNGDPLPLFRRFFPGGINSVRGYRNRSLGPQDTKGHEFGGSKQLVNNTEIIFPLVNSAGLRGVLFYDIGQAFDDNQTLKLDDLRKAWGYGIRWGSPIGPIRIEFGYPIDRQDGERGVVTNFSFGAPF